MLNNVFVEWGQDQFEIYDSDVDPEIVEPDEDDADDSSSDSYASCDYDDFCQDGDDRCSTDTDCAEETDVQSVSINQKCLTGTENKGKSSKIYL